MPDELRIRRASLDEARELVELASLALGWDPSRPNLELFSWKHGQNPFGISPVWVAESDGELVGLRVFLRWRFRDVDSRPVTAARAVDTATHPRHRGRGVFSELTRTAVSGLVDDGIAFIFNTPNEQSRPGYLKLGWRIGGRAPLAIRPRPGGLPRLPGARHPAERWSLPTSSGRDPNEVFSEASSLEELLGVTHPAGRVATDLTPELLRWRYGFGPLHYRVVTLGRDVADGFAVFRRRRRGSATEVTVCDVIVPPDASRRDRRTLARRVRDAAPGDYLIRAGGPLLAADGFVRVPDQGPIVTLREVNRPPPRFSRFAFRLGDLELF